MTKTWLNKNVVLFDSLDAFFKNILHSVVIHIGIPNTDQIIYFSPSTWGIHFITKLWILNDSHFNYFNFSNINFITKRERLFFFFCSWKGRAKLSIETDDVIFTSGRQYKHVHYPGFEILNTETAMSFLSSCILVQYR